MVDLIDALSHPEVMDRLEVLSGCKLDSRTSPRPSAEPVLRRPFGEVAEAVLQVLQAAGHELTYIQIYHAVNNQLGGEVSKSSVKNALVRAVTGNSQQLVRLGHGRYRHA